jgi:hypothetical protein
MCTEFPGRTVGEVVPLSTVTFELDGGALWREVGDWDAVSTAVRQLARERGCDSVRLPQDQVRDAILAMGPNSENFFHAPDGTYRMGLKNGETNSPRSPHTWPPWLWNDPCGRAAR